MKQSIKKWTIRIAAVLVLLAGLLIGLMFNPFVLYSHRTEVDNFIVYHNEDLDAEIEKRLINAHELLKKSEFYNSDLKLKICLNDGSPYPKLMGWIRGQAFAWGFYEIIVMQGEADFKLNTVELNNYKWNLEQLIAHEAVHCAQFNKLGLWHSNPVKSHPVWKWEGYPEYVARKNDDQTDFRHNLERLLKYEEESPSAWAIYFSDSTITSINYFEDWLLVKYCLDVRELSYEELLNDNMERAHVEKEMWTWFKGS